MGRLQVGQHLACTQWGRPGKALEHKKWSFAVVAVTECHVMCLQLCAGLCVSLWLLCMQLGCIDFIAMTTAIGAVGGIGPKKDLHPIKPDPQICVPSKLGLMAFGYLIGCVVQSAIIAILCSRDWYHGSNSVPYDVSPTLPHSMLQPCRLQAHTSGSACMQQHVL